MIRPLLAAILILPALVAGPAGAQAAVTATLSLPHDHVLPGVPFDMVVTYTNATSRPITIASAGATLVVTFENGETSVLDHPDLNDRSNIASSLPLELRPGQSAEQAVSWGAGSIPNWFLYSSFSAPGTYGIALDLTIADDDLNPLASVRTSTAKLTRINPVGIDAELWQRMLQLSDGDWASNAFRATSVGVKLAEEIIHLYPASEYYPYALTMMARWPWRQPLPTLLEAAGRFPSSPAHAYLLLAAADYAHSEAIKAERARDLGRTQQFAQLADTSYRQALTTKSIGVRANAVEGLRRIKQIMERASKKMR